MSRVTQISAEAATRVAEAVEQERAAWVERIEAHAAEIEAGLANDGHFMTSSERKTQQHIVITLRALLPAEHSANTCGRF